MGGREKKNYKHHKDTFHCKLTKYKYRELPVKVTAALGIQSRGLVQLIPTERMVRNLKDTTV